MESLVLSPQDVENLEAMSDGSTGYFYKMLDYLEKRVEDGVRRGRFSEEAAKADLETVYGINITFPNGTLVSVKKGCAKSVMALMKLYEKEDAVCLD